MDIIELKPIISEIKFSLMGLLAYWTLQEKKMDTLGYSVVDHESVLNEQVK